MQRLEVSGAVRLIYRSLGVKGLILRQVWHTQTDFLYGLINFMAKGFRRRTYM